MPTGGEGLAGAVAPPIWGTPSSVKNSYWNSSINGVMTSKGGGEAKTTEEMVKRSTYLDWNFEDIWHIQEEISYPTLRR